jgi:hypothetical protein
MELMSLLVRISMQGGDQAAHGLRRIKSEAKGADDATERLSKSLAGLRLPLLDVMSAASGLAAGLGLLVAAFGQLSGIARAAELSPMRAQFRALVGDVREADRVLRDLKKTAAGSLYDTRDVGRLGSLLLGAGTKSGDVGRESAALVNVLSASSVDRTGLRDSAFNLTQIRSGAGDAADIKELLGRAVALPAMLQRATGETWTKDGLLTYYNERGGEALYRLLIRAGESEQVKSVASQMAAGDPAAQGAKLIESLRDIFAPTGDLLIQIMAPVGAVAKVVADGLGAINAATGGKAGLALVLALLVKGGSLLYGSFRALVRSAIEAAAALRLIAMQGVGAGVAGAAAAGSAAVAAGASAGAGAIVGAGTAAAGTAAGARVAARAAVSAGGAVIPEGMRQVYMNGQVYHVPANFPRAATQVSRLQRLRGALGGLGGLLRGLNLLTIIPFLASMGLEAGGSLATSRGNSVLGSTLSGAGQQMGLWSLGGGLLGAAIGGGIGALAGGVGAIPGAALGFKVGTGAGALIGGVKGGVEGYQAGKAALAADAAAQAQQRQHQKALEANTRALEGVRIALIGGGPRASDATRVLEMEYALARTLSF